MENILNVNTRILIGQELGEVYLIIQAFVNDKWQHLPNHQYKGNYFVNKKLKELLKYDICNVRKGKKIDMIKFKIAENTHVYLNDYSIIKDYPEIKKLDKILTQKLIFQRVNNKITIIKNQKHKLIDDVFKITITSALSLGMINTFMIDNESLTVEKNNQPVTYKVINNLSSKYDNESETKQNEEVVKTNINSSEDEGISEYKLTDNQINVSTEKSSRDLLIEKYAEMYYMDILQVTNIYNENYEEIINSDNPEQAFLIKVKDCFYSDTSIDKTPIINTMTSEEKEQIIIDIAKNIYKIEDENNLALLLSIHRLESDNGNSRRCVEDNNPGGLKEGNNFLKFKTFEIGAESFVRNVQKIINRTNSLENYDSNISFESNMQTIYCPGESDWGIKVESIKNSILKNKELDIYINENIEKNKVFIYKK